jgi:hypothetical protein
MGNMLLKNWQRTVRFPREAPDLLPHIRAANRISDGPSNKLRYGMVLKTEHLVLGVLYTIEAHNSTSENRNRAPTERDFVPEE